MSFSLANRYCGNRVDQKARWVCVCVSGRLIRGEGVCVSNSGRGIKRVCLRVKIDQEGVLLLLLQIECVVVVIVVVIVIVVYIIKPT